MFWTNSWTFKTARFCVTLDYTDEPDPDLSWADDETLANLKSGLWGNFLFRVRVTLDGAEVGCDYLGNSIYQDPDDFRDHIGLAAYRRRTGQNCGSYFADMVRAAIAEARQNVKPAPKMHAA